MISKIYKEASYFLGESFHVLEELVPSPVPTESGENIVLRYHDDHRCLEVAIIQKLARYISGLSASLLLLESGYTQERGTIFRTLDEFGEDIRFLALPIVGGIKITETHKQYLEDFFQEEFDRPGNAFLSTQKRKTIPRKKIRSVLAESEQSGLNASDQRELSRTISQGYSGFVHGASSRICEMVGGNPLRYHLTGMAGTTRQAEFAFNCWDYAYRELLSVVITAKVFNKAEVVDSAYKFIEYFEARIGDTGSGDPEKLMKKVKRNKN